MTEHTIRLYDNSDSGEFQCITNFLEEQGYPFDVLHPEISTFAAFRDSPVVMDLMRSLGPVEFGSNLNATVSDIRQRETWASILQRATSFANFKHAIILANDQRKGWFVKAVTTRAGTASSGEFQLLMAIAAVCDFAHVADKLHKQPWQNIDRADEHHRAAICACIMNLGY